MAVVAAFWFKVPGLSSQGSHTAGWATCQVVRPQHPVGGSSGVRAGGSLGARYGAISTVVVAGFCGNLALVVDRQASHCRLSLGGGYLFIGPMAGTFPSVPKVGSTFGIILGAGS